MKNDLADNPTIIKSCDTCEHRDFNMYCGRVGRYCQMEMQSGDKCNQQGKLTLWVRRVGFFPRLYRSLFGE